jgi:putative acetyltransferase
LQSHLVLALSAPSEIVASAGWIAVPDEPGTARVRKVFVHPSLARRGLATRLILDAERRALAAGYARLMVRANLNAVRSI